MSETSETRYKEILGRVDNQVGDDIKQIEANWRPQLKDNPIEQPTV
ncbi:MAG: hypothetical protein ABR909_04920 [Candidatus Bathyarchaeia archaeon]|jgi:hypothetical protein